MSQRESEQIKLVLRHLGSAIKGEALLPSFRDQESRRLLAALSELVRTDCVAMPASPLRKLGVGVAALMVECLHASTLAERDTAQVLRRARQDGPFEW